MKVNVWGINYKPELIGIAVYNAQLCEFLAGRQHDVTMVTALPYYPAWKVDKPYRGKLFAHEQIDGINVHRSWLYVPSRPSVLRRAIHEVSFTITSMLRQLFLPPPDVYLVVSPPLFLGLAVWLISLLKQRPFVFHIQDLQPDTALELSMLKSSFVSKILYGIEAFIYKQAARVSAPTQRICNLLIEQKKLPASKVVYFPNWVKLPERIPAESGWKEKHGVKPGTALVTYCGNVGVKQGLEVVVDAALKLQGKNHAMFLIAGNGARKNALEELARNQHPDNLLLSDVLPEDEHTQVLIDSSVCLITQMPGSGRGFFPSKLLKILAYERPIITNAEAGTPLHDAVVEGQFGVCLASNSGTELAETVCKLVDDKVALERMGKAGRTYVSQFDRERVLSAAENMLLEVVRERSR